MAVLWGGPTTTHSHDRRLLGVGVLAGLLLPKEDRKSMSP